MDKNDVKGIEESISVTVRIRPLTKKENERGCTEAWKTPERDTILSMIDGGKVSHTFGTFLIYYLIYLDNVFDGSSTTNQVFDKVGKDLVSSVLKGMNGTLFAYGQTASGKTHTMEGNESTPGILPLAIDTIFDMIEEMPHFQFMIHVSYIEIFNEQVKDLLADEDKNLRIREDPEKGFFVDDLTTQSVISIDEILELKRKGELKRHTGETNMNLRSSRSHTIFTLKIEMRDIRVFDENKLDKQEYRKRPSENFNSTDDFCYGVLIGKLNLVDLAGSENAKQTQAEGSRLTEAANINKSLLSLSRVISQLSGSTDSFINWRDSKLTQILQPCLGGNCKTSVICCIRAGKDFFEESKSTLNFAAQTKKIKNKVKVNEVLDGEGEIQKLKGTVKALENQLKTQQQENTSKKALESEIEKLKALLIVGGGEDEQAVSARIATEQKRRKKMRMTWCPGKRVSFAPKVTKKLLDFGDDLEESIQEQSEKPFCDRGIRKSIVEPDDFDLDSTCNSKGFYGDLTLQSEQNQSINEEKETLRKRIEELESIIANKENISENMETFDNTYNSKSFVVADTTTPIKTKDHRRDSGVALDLLGFIDYESKIAKIQEEQEIEGEAQQNKIKVLEKEKNELLNKLNEVKEMQEKEDENHQLKVVALENEKEELLDKMIKDFDQLKEQTEESAAANNFKIVALENEKLDLETKIEEFVQGSEVNKTIQSLLDNIENNLASDHKVEAKVVNSSLEVELEFKQTEIEKLNKAVAESAAEIENIMTSVVPSLEIKNEKYLSELSEKEKKLLETEEELALKKENEVKLEESMKELNENIKRLETENPTRGIDFEDKFNTLEKEFLELKNEKVRLMSKLTSSTTNSEVSSDHLHKALSQLQMQVDLKNQEIEKLTIKINEMGKEHKELQFVLENQLKDITGLTNKSADNEVKENEEKRKLHSMLEAKSIELENLKTYSDKMSKKTEEAEAKVLELEKCNQGIIENIAVSSDLEEKCGRQLEAIQALEKKLETYSKEKMEKDETILLLETNLSKVQDTVFELKQSKTDCTKCFEKVQEIDRLKELSDGVKYSVETTEKRLMELNNVVQTLTQQNSELTNRLHRSVESKKALETDELEVQEKLNSLMSENEAQKEVIAKLKSFIEEQEPVFKKSLEEKKTLETLSEQLNVEKESLVQEVKLFEERCKELDEQIIKKNQRIKKLDKSKMTKDRLDRMVKIVSETEKIKALNKTIVEYVKNNFEVDENFNVKEFIQFLQELKEERDGLSEKHNSYIKRIKTQKNQLQQQEKVEKEYKNLQRTNKALLKEISGKGDAGLVSLTKELETKLNDATTKVNILETELSNIQDKNNARISELESENVDLLKENKKYKLANPVANKENERSFNVHASAKKKEVKSLIKEEKSAKLYSRVLDKETSGLSSPHPKNCKPS